MGENNAPLRFRRNSQTSRGSGRKAIGVFLALFLLLGLAFAIGRLFEMPKTPTAPPPLDAPLRLQWIDKNTYVLGKDTTSYEALASTLLDSLRSMKKRYAAEQIFVQLSVPDTLQTADFQDLIQIIQATNTRWVLKKS